MFYISIKHRLFFLILFIFCFLGLHLWHMEVPRVRVESELQLLAYTTDTATPDPSYICNLCCISWQCRILNPLSEARDRTHNICNIYYFLLFLSFFNHTCSMWKFPGQALNLSNSRDQSHSSENALNLLGHQWTPQKTHFWISFISHNNDFNFEYLKNKYVFYFKFDLKNLGNLLVFSGKYNYYEIRCVIGALHIWFMQCI